MERKSRNLWQTLPLYVACYAIWLALAALGIWLLFEWQTTLFRLAVWLRANPWVARAIERFGVVTLGLAWLVGILWLEDYLRSGVEKDVLWKRAARATLIAALLVGLCYGIRIVL